MIRSLLQFARDGERGEAVLDAEGNAREVVATRSVLDLAKDALSAGANLASTVAPRIGEAIDLSAVRLLVPIDHPDPSQCLVSGTGLTHLGSAEGRDKMHRSSAAGQATDSMRMFLMGLEGGQPVRLGFALGNQFSDHVTERANYLWLAHSKLRQAALGAELLLGDLPQDVRGASRILRGGETIWERPFLTGEANMSHSLANLEHHHFKYTQFRRPGQVHVHFFGTATLSFSDGFSTEEGDEFEISADAFMLPLRNRLAAGAESDKVAGLTGVKCL